MWQPIETAPKDGSSILLSTPKGRIADGFWHVPYKVWSWPYVMVEPTHWMPLPDAPGAQAQPAPSFADAYQGAMEEVAIWKKRALEAEDLNRKFVAEINGPMLMGEPVAQPAPSVPELVESLRCACNYIDKLGGASQQYRAMLAAAAEAKP